MTGTDNETIIRTAYAAYARGDLNTMLSFVDPDLQWTYLDPGVPDPEPQVCHGRGDLGTALRRQAERGLTSHIDEIRSSGEQVLVIAHTPGVDTYRATPAQDRNYDVFTVQNGHIVALRAYPSRADALAAIG